MLGTLALMALMAYAVLLAVLFAAVAFPETCVPPAPCFRPELPAGTRVDIAAYASERAHASPGSAAALFWLARDVELYAPLNATVPLPIPPAVRIANATLWAHFLVYAPERDVDEPAADGAVALAQPYDPARVPVRRPLLRTSAQVVGHVLPYSPLDYLVPALAPAGAPPAPAAHASAPLGTTLADAAKARESGALAAVDGPSPPPPPRAPSPHFLYAGRALRVRVVADFHAHAASELPDGVRLRPSLGERGDEGRGGDSDGGWVWRGGGWGYLPPLYADTFSLLRRHAVQMSDDISRSHPRVEIDWRPRSLLVHRCVLQLAQALDQLGSLAGFGAAELEDVRELLGEERLERVLVEQAFGWAHGAFAYLAFRSEVRFWRGRTDTAGLSARTLLINAGCSLVVLAYLWEGEGTNRILLLSSSADFAVQAWKALTLVAARAARARARRGARARRAADEARAVAREAATESFDALAFGAVGACVLPLGAGLALHTLVQYPHRSWRAWLLDASAKAVYLFGFVAMTPQLFVNYKLKSVSHLPWRVLCYKAFTTFVDDAFSLLVSMPTAHRVACLRDDLVFFALLYQRRCFPVDLSRANEYGYAYAPAAAEERAALECAPAAAEERAALECAPAAAEERAALECAPAAARAPGGGRADAHSGLRRVSLSDRSLGGT